MAAQNNRSFDTLESRRLMSATILVNGSDVVVNGSAGNDALVVSYDGANLVVTENGATAATAPVTAAGSDLTVNGLEGNDTLVLDNSLSAFDTRTASGGTGYWDRLQGSASDDKLVDPDGVFTAYAGAGNDVMDLTFAGDWTKQAGSTQRRMDGRVQGNGGDDTIVLTALPGTKGALFFSVKGDNVDYKPTDPDGNDTVLFYGNYAGGSVVNLDSRYAPRNGNDSLFASKGGINTGGDTQVTTLTKAQADAIVASIRA